MSIVQDKNGLLQEVNGLLNSDNIKSLRSRVITDFRTPVTSLPTGPQEGDSCIFIADSSAGVHWHLRYYITTAKWHFIGGPSLYAEITTEQSTTSTTYAALTTAGPSIAVPLAGDYDVAIGVNGFNTGAVSDMHMSYDIEGTGAVDADSVHIAPSTTTRESGARLRRKTGLAAVTLTAKYKTSAGTGNFKQRWITVTPVTVS